MKVLIYSIGSHGDLRPFLVLGDALVREGHTVRILTLSRYRKDIESRGFEFFGLTEDWQQSESELSRLALDPDHGLEFLLRNLVFPRLPETYRRLEEAANGADRLISGSLAFPSQILCEKTGMPWISVGLQPMVFVSPSRLPVMPEAPWLRHLTRKSRFISSVLLNAFRARTNSWSSEWYAFRKELGLQSKVHPLFDAIHSPMQQWAAYPEFFSGRNEDWPPQRQHIGFLQHDPSEEEPLPIEVENFLAAGEPPIIFTLGTAAVHSGEKFLETCLAFLTRSPLRSVIACGPLESEWKTRFQGLSHVFVTGYCPYSKLFPRSRLTVHQGGIGTTAEALRAGVPTVVVPFGQDQYDNASQIAEIGAGGWVPMRDLNPKKLQRVIEQTLNGGCISYRSRMVGENSAQKAMQLFRSFQ